MIAPERLAAALADRYRIERELGAGGMATVYLAADLKHDRKVAIKVLKPELAAVLGAERFVVEIKTTAALSHPHILPLFDSGEAAGFLYYVMPYIQGETIREKLNREGQFAISEALRITTEIADALDYAHRNGVVHRDIKPENILLHDGRPMVMDFGIALAVSAAAGGRMTETGLSLGTPHYMSPEQATADKQITARSDVYSLASVLYEMLAGEPPHTGGSAQAIIMKIIAESARPVSELRKSVPPQVVGALQKALEKVPADRFETAREFATALGTVGFTYGTAAIAAVGAAATAGRASRRVAFAATVVAVFSLAAAVAGWKREMPEPPFRRFDLDFGLVERLTGNDPVISPDGQMIAAAGTLNGVAGIYLRRLDGDADFRLLEGSEGGNAPSFSPDNQWIVFRRSTDRTLVKVRVGGGGAVTLTGSGNVDPFNPHWGDDDRIVFSGPLGGGIVSSVGGDVKALPSVRGRRVFLLPDGSGVLSGADGSVMLYEFDTDSSRVLFTGGSHPVYIKTGHLLYVATEGGLFAVPFDLKTRQLDGAPVRVLERVGSTLAARGYSVSASGMLLQHDADLGGSASGARSRLVIVDPGKAADTVRIPDGLNNYPRFSADGRYLAVERVSPERIGSSDIYTTDLVTGSFTQLTFDDDNDQPAWSPDGKWIAYDRVPSNASLGGEVVCVKRADNSAAERCLGNTHGGQVEVEQWIDSTTLLYAASSVGQRGDIYTVDVNGGAPKAYSETPLAEWGPRLSPDGKLIVFEATESSGIKLWIRDFPEPIGRWSVSPHIAFAPRWSPDGRFVYYWRAGAPNDTLFRVRIDRNPGVVVRDEEIVQVVDIAGINNWDLHPDGRRYVLSLPTTNAAQSVDGRSTDRYLVLENWFSELQRLMAVPPR